MAVTHGIIARVACTFLLTTCYKNKPTQQVALYRTTCQAKPAPHPPPPPTPFPTGRATLLAAICALGVVVSSGVGAGSAVVSGIQLGNVWIGVQPALGVEGDPMRLLFDRFHPLYVCLIAGLCTCMGVVFGAFVLPAGDEHFCAVLTACLQSYV